MITTTRIYDLLNYECGDSGIQCHGDAIYCAGHNQCACYDFLDTIEEGNIPTCAYNSSNEGKGVLLMSLDFDEDFSSTNHTEAENVIYNTLSPQIPSSADFDVLTSEDGSFYVNIRVYYTVNDFNRTDFINFASTTNYSFSIGNFTTDKVIIVNSFPSNFAPTTTTTTTTTTSVYFSPPTTAPKDHNGLTIGLAAGGGGGFLLICVGLFIYFSRRRRKRVQTRLIWRVSHLTNGWTVV